MGMGGGAELHWAWGGKWGDDGGTIHLAGQEVTSQEHVENVGMVGPCQGQA